MYVQLKLLLRGSYGEFTFSFLMMFFILSILKMLLVMNNHGS